MLKRFALIAVVFCFAITSAPADTIVEWDFTTGMNGWSVNSSIENVSTTAEGLDFDVTGEDPNINGPAYDYSGWFTERVVIRMRSNGDASGELFYGAAFSGDRRIPFTVTTDNAWHEYTFDVPAFSPNWRLRLDPAHASGHITIAWIRVEGVSSELRIDNGTIEIGMDLTAGGAITFLSLSGENSNIINVHDRGRMVQQSYYAGQSLDRTADGQSPSWSPWAWNPIQVGDAFGNSGEVLAAVTTGTTMAYTKTYPLLWDMNNEFGQCHMEQWTTLEGNVAHIRNKLTCFRDLDDLWDLVRLAHQELPAVYTIADLPYLYTYTGDQPFESQALTRIINDPNDGFIWDYYQANEYWAANVNDTSGNGWGLGVYNRETTLHVGGLAGTVGGGPTAGSTAYISPLATVALHHTSEYEYEYDLIVGTLSEIRQYVYDNPPPNPFGSHQWLFDTDDDYEGWTLFQHMDNDAVASGVLAFDLSGNDPIMVSPPVSIIASANRYLHLRMKNGSTGGTGQFFWTNGNGGPGTPGNDKAFALSTSDTEFQTYVLDMSGEAGWTGSITQLRFDPIAGASTGHVEIDTIAVWPHTELFTESPKWTVY